LLLAFAAAMGMMAPSPPHFPKSPEP